MTLAQSKNKFSYVYCCICSDTDEFKISNYYAILFEALSGSQWFSTLDLLWDYWQVEMSEEDRQKTALSTYEGLYEFLAAISIVIVLLSLHFVPFTSWTAHITA